jgi:hypothetical protein
MCKMSDDWLCYIAAWVMKAEPAVLSRTQFLSGPPPDFVTVLARPDFYYFTLDSNGNLAPKDLYVLSNDLGAGLRIVSYKPSTGFEGIVGVAGVGPDRHLTYEVQGYRCGHCQCCAACCQQVGVLQLKA